MAHAHKSKEKGKMITIFSTCKPFEGIYDTIQKNAIRSWSKVAPVILFGDEPGVADMAKEIGCRHAKKVKRNQYGTPLLGPLFNQAARLANTDTLCYVNADIIMPRNMLQAVKVTKGHLSSFLITGPRWTVDIRHEIKFGSNWHDELVKVVKAKGRQCQPTGLDYFIFTPDVYAFKFKPIAIGRYSWDNWLLWKAQQLGFSVVDATKIITAIHQEHPRLAWTGSEVRKNLRLAGARGRSGYIWEANFVLYADKLVPRKDSNQKTWRKIHGWTGTEV
jgi:hypothetical protein